MKSNANATMPLKLKLGAGSVADVSVRSYASVDFKKSFLT
jgi:hypothetical protein